MNKARKDQHSNHLYITYLSAIAKGQIYPRGMANQVNPKVKHDFGTDIQDKVAHVGIVVFDYVTTDYARMVYQTNWGGGKAIRSPGTCDANWSWFKCKMAWNRCNSGFRPKKIYRGTYCICECV